MFNYIGVAGIKYNGVWYVYKRDAQNNVIAILDNTGKTVVEYTYNAWGYHTVSGSLASSVGAVNPFRYRSYFYDTETQLYFLKTRYYDPLIGRFLNMDSISYADPETINGLNLYAYCGNNPVMNVDPDGNLFSGLFIQVFVSLWSYVGIAVASIFDKDIRQDMNEINWNPFNTDELKVLKADKVSFYKGVPVYRIGGSRSGTFTAIFLTHETSYRTDAIDVVKHEWGHIPQQMFLGPIKYGICIGIPSAAEMGSWSKSGYYYKAPWEVSADYFGGASTGVHSHSGNEIKKSIEYLIISNAFGIFSYFYCL